MGQSDEAWNDAVEKLKTLGSMFTYHDQAEEGAAVVSEDEVMDALRTLGASIKAAFATVGDAFKDPEVQAEARQAAGSFFDALGATFSELGDDISKRRESGDSPSTPPPEEAA